MKLTALALVAVLFTLASCASKTSNPPPPPVDMGVRSGK